MHPHSRLEVRPHYGSWASFPTRRVENAWEGARACEEMGVSLLWAESRWVFLVAEAVLDD